MAAFMFHSSFFHSLFFLFAYLCIPLELVYIMLKLTTSVERPAHCPCIDYRHTLLLLGSCFATHIGERLEEAKFRCDVNPYGVLYNPLSIATALREMVARKVYIEADLYEHQGLWHSPMHHGDFSAPTHDEALARINGRLAQASDELDRLDFLLLTWGTAWVYEDRKTGRVAGNCHKLPESCFRRRRLSVDEIVADTVSLLSGLVARSNGRLRVVLTISPIRHVRDGLHANQLSKATLLLAAEQVAEAFPDHVFYFPAYELLIDELRDYRFFADDLVHPSLLAVQYVWEHFADWCLAPETASVRQECEEIRKALSHRPLRPESEQYKRFLGQIVLKIERLNGKYPYLDFKNEKETCHILLNKSAKS